MSIDFLIVKRFIRIIVVVVTLGFISVLDHNIRDLELTLLYIIPLVYICWKENFIWGLVITLFAGFFWIIGEIIKPPITSSSFSLYWDILVRPILFIGIGIKKKDFDKITEEHYRTKESVKKSSGFGIGLKLTRDILEMHDSKLELKSEIDKGSKFSFSLPLYKEGISYKTKKLY